jgi:tRNA threonylcarbamoyladenosine biosynthesis protein TsaE
MKLEFKSQSEKDTQQLAILVADSINASWFGSSKEGILIGLSGQLGAGKTEFVRGFMDYFSAASAVSSPSFVLECIYPVKTSPNILEVRHWDLYRLSAMDEVANELHEKTNSVVTIVEWPEKVAGVCDLLSLSIKIETMPNADESRIIVLQGESALLSKIKDNCECKKIKFQIN